MTPNDSIDMIFTKLSLIYGRDFLSKWEGLDIQDVKNDWVHELSALRFSSIRYALKNIDPLRPPNVLQFRALALRAPTENIKKIDPPLADQELVKEEIKKAKALLKSWKND